MNVIADATMVAMSVQRCLLDVVVTRRLLPVAHLSEWALPQQSVGLALNYVVAGHACNLSGGGPLDASIESSCGVFAGDCCDDVMWWG